MDQINSYRKLTISLLISFLIMYGVMFLNVDDGSHIYLSLTRAYMSLLMVTPMAVLMIFMMKKMFMNKRKNTLYILSSITLFVLSLILLRTQTPVSDVQYMKAMIPHHSSAILTSKHAKIKDAEVKKLSLSIIESQEREIRQMKEILKRMEK